MTIETPHQIYEHCMAAVPDGTPPLAAKETDEIRQGSDAMRRVVEGIMEEEVATLERAAGTLTATGAAVANDAREANAAVWTAARDQLAVVARVKARVDETVADITARTYDRLRACESQLENAIATSKTRIEATDRPTLMEGYRAAGAAKISPAAGVPGERRMMVGSRVQTTPIVKDESAVPREYLEPKMTAIRKAVRADRTMIGRTPWLGDDPKIVLTLHANSGKLVEPTADDDS